MSQTISKPTPANFDFSYLPFKITPIKLSSPPTWHPDHKPTLVEKPKLVAPSRSVSDLGANLEKFACGLKHCTQLPFVPSNKKASDWVKDQKEGLIGTLRRQPLSKINLDEVQDIVKRSRYETKVKVFTLLGAPGSSKSTDLRNEAIRLGAFEASCALTVICPRAEQRKDWERLTKLSPSKDYLIKTFETPFYQPVADVVIIEETGQMLPNWLDALLIYRANIKYVFILGDTEQNFSHIPNSAANSFNCPNPLTVLSDLAEENNIELKYRNESYRLSPDVCKIKGVKPLVERPPIFVQEVTKHSAALPLLTTSDDRVKKAAINGFREVYTYQDSQGKDFKNEKGEYIAYQMLLTKDCLHYEERVFYTAITRSNVGIYLRFEDQKAKIALMEYARDVPSLQFLFDKLHEHERLTDFQVEKLTGSNQLRPLAYNRSWGQIQEAMIRLRRAAYHSPKDYPKRNYPNFQFDFRRNTKLQVFTVEEYSFIAAAVGHDYPCHLRHENCNQPHFRRQLHGWTFIE